MITRSRTEPKSKAFINSVPYHQHQIIPYDIEHCLHGIEQNKTTKALTDSETYLVHVIETQDTADYIVQNVSTQSIIHKGQTYINSQNQIYMSTEPDSDMQ